ncbi:MAG: aminoglycoside phosphotransferase family protein [Bacteroidales bacterium]|nr:aminoglycoside phosphotransferase family protein [Bacteroidales bacterium]
MKYNIREILENFRIPGKFISTEVNKTGLINDTYIAVFDDNNQQTSFVLQRINTLVFTKPVEVMANIDLILVHQAKKVMLDPDHPDPKRGVLKLVYAKNGRSFYHDTDDNYWRVYYLIENTVGFDIAETEAQAYEAAKMFGRFGRYLSDLDVKQMHATIPDFHNIVKRYEALELSSKKDEVNRKDKCLKEIDFAMDRKYLCDTITGLLRENNIPVRVTHNDTKINNVLMDRETRKGLCVIDLDTVMPGTVLSDFGDMVRTFTNSVNEDVPDVSKVKMRLNIFRAMAEGYLSEANDFLTPVEKSNLVYGGKLITLMQGIRNLTDYLKGDVYYKIDYPEHNLDRTRNQFALILSIEEQEKKMEEIIENL